MDRQKAGTLIGVIASISFIATAALHTTGYDSVTGLAMQGPTDLHGLVPGLWLIFAFDLVVVGLIVGVAAFRPGKTSRAVLSISALSPFCAAGLQVWFLGFIPPTGILIGVGLITLLAAVLMKGDYKDGLPKQS